jgi:hypothetical protein
VVEIEETAMTRDRFLILFLRVVGSVAGSAALCAVMPLHAMAAAHRALGMGPLPSQPIVEYLARSTSAFYALLGVLLWALSFDVSRYRPLVRGTGLAFIALGVLLLWTDIGARLPLFWQVAEGPINALFGIILVWAGGPENAGECV